jgi:hypothetical protein
MKIAYIVSGLEMSMTFVANEMESHENNGWEVLPLISQKRPHFKNLSPLMLKWNEGSIFRPSLIDFLLGCIKISIKFPARTINMLLWLLALSFASFTEFLKALYELFPAFYYAAICHEKKIEWIHVHFASRSLSLGNMIAILLDRPLSCTVHAFDIFMRSSSSLKYRFSKCMAVIPISKYNTKYLAEKCGNDVAIKCHMIHCCCGKAGA